MGGHAVQVLFDNLGRSTRKTSVNPEDTDLHHA